MTPYEKYSLIVNLFLAIFTFVAVVLALFGENIRQFWNKPKLNISLIDPSLNQTGSGIQGWFYLLRVFNLRRSSPAKNVRILLTRIFKKGPDDSWQEIIFSGPVQVMWRWPQFRPIFATVGPDEIATFGLLYSNSNAFQLQLYWVPNNLKDTIPSNQLTRLVFQAVSDTAESNELTVEVAWDGAWVSGSAEMKKHLVVKELK